MKKYGVSEEVLEWSVVLKFAYLSYFHLTPEATDMMVII